MIMYTRLRAVTMQSRDFPADDNCTSGQWLFCLGKARPTFDSVSCLFVWNGGPGLAGLNSLFRYEQEFTSDCFII